MAIPTLRKSPEVMVIVMLDPLETVVEPPLELGKITDPEVKPISLPWIGIGTELIEVEGLETVLEPKSTFNKFIESTDIATGGVIAESRAVRIVSNWDPAAPVVLVRVFLSTA
jgi:hypothetical protein